MVAEMQIYFFGQWWCQNAKYPIASKFTAVASNHHRCVQDLFSVIRTEIKGHGFTKLRKKHRFGTTWDRLHCIWMCWRVHPWFTTLNLAIVLFLVLLIWVKACVMLPSLSMQATTMPRPTVCWRVPKLQDLNPPHHVQPVFEAPCSSCWVCLLTRISSSCRTKKRWY